MLKMGVEKPGVLFLSVMKPIESDLSMSWVTCEIIQNPSFKIQNLTMSPLDILQSNFGYTSFRLEQEAIIQSVIQKKDTFALMPTGGGKSLCYQIPALFFEGLTIVVSPLIALMKDQVDALRLNGVSAAYLNSTQSYGEQEEVLARIRSKELKLLYLAPEKLIRTENSFFNILVGFDISLIAIDEAHCISHWGHDFRPEYLMLAQLRNALPHVPVIALTATADRLTRKDIVEKLALREPATFISSFNRANIRYSVEPKKRSFERLLTFLEKRTDESGIIYCLSRNSTENLARDLTQTGFQALAYHAGMDRDQRTRNQELFLRDEVKIMVATIAFGMGIDKSNVRYVVHMDLPKSIESYYQETGRAGRDGLNSDALLFYSYADVSKMKGFVKIEDNPEQTEIYLKKLDQMARYGDLATCRRKYLLNYFDESTSGHCGNCDVCLASTELVDATVPAQKVLSAVTRLQERFGVNYVIDFLRGSTSAKISEQHSHMKTFGIGADTSKEEWAHIIRELLAREYLTKSEGNYPLLKLTAQSHPVLKGEANVMLAKPKERIELQEQLIDYADYEMDLFQQLKEVRRKLAVEENVPAYIVLSDATLMELATYLPHTLEEIGKVSGFGQIKLERYGKDFEDAVVMYCREHQLTSRIHLKLPKARRKEKLERDSDTKQQSLDLFRLGHSLETISGMRGLSPTTIETHLAFYIQQGDLNIDQFVTKERVTAILQAIDSVGGKALTPIRASLGDAYSFGEIKFVMAHRASSF
jgi:ATP-dependent DNA helicase RecQ